MTSTLFYSALVLGIIALVAAVVLYVVARRFAVKRDVRIDQVATLLPGANCGGCGFAGCSAMAGALVKAADKGDISSLQCPVGGSGVMRQIASTLGVATVATESMVAVVRCNGDCKLRPVVAEFDGVRTCHIMNMQGRGESACGYGCLGCGDCVAACRFGAISINPDTHLPQVDTGKCTACGACAKACPRQIIELRPSNAGKGRIYVACRNTDKGAVARKACQAACIGCGKCARTCKHGAIEMQGALAYIDYTKCVTCGDCVAVCPTGAIHADNYTAQNIAS